MSVNTGKIGSDTYYCSDCLLEFACNGNEITIYYIDPEGVSYALKDRGEPKLAIQSSGAMNCSFRKHRRN